MKKETEISVAIQELQEIQKEVKINDSMAVVPEDNEKMEKERKRTIVFRPYSNLKKKMKWFEDRIIENALSPIMGKIETFQRGKLYGSIRAVFHDKQTTVEIPHKTHLTQEMFYSLLYGKKNCRGRD